MKKKSTFYMILGLLGIALMAAAIVLDGKVSHTMDGTLTGVGAALTGLGISRWRFLRWRTKNPAKWKQYEIESNDERNMIIRLKAQAIAGEMLQWAVMVAAWVAIFLDAPLWVTLTFVGIFLFKSILEVYLMGRYQKTM